MIFPDYHPPDAIRINHEMTKNELRPKNHHGFEHARAEDDRWRSIVANWRLTRRNPAPIHTNIRPNIPRGIRASSNKASRPSPETIKWRKL